MQLRGEDLEWIARPEGTRPKKKKGPENSSPFLVGATGFEPVTPCL